MNELANRRVVGDIVDEYNYKIANLKNALASFDQAKTDIMTASCVAGGMTGKYVDLGRVYDHQMAHMIRHSAWDKLYKVANLDVVLTAKDRSIYAQSMIDPPEFNLDNIIATFGEHIKDPRKSILRGLAEVFCDLDPYYKSHEKIKIGAAKMPKRVIISGFDWFNSSATDKLKDIINALSVYQGRPLLDYAKVKGFADDGELLRESHGLWLKRFNNGNGHLFFGKRALQDINSALAEFYGDVLADTNEEKPSEKQQSKEVSKDLQYYPTPKSVIDRYLIPNIHLENAKVLEPSCGCGRILDALKGKGAVVSGVEFDSGRAAESRSKGHNVLQANFLEVEPDPVYDYVVMNPPFYGRHYAKHIKHAYKFLKDNGSLYSILPSSARYDHNELDEFGCSWTDLPVGSFSESGTNINTSLVAIRKRGG